MPAPRLIDLSTPKSRRRLPLLPTAKPHWHLLAEGRFIGYRRIKGTGSWCARYYHSDIGRYAEEKLGPADDLIPADGIQILSYSQALKATMAWCDEQAGLGRRDACADRRYTVAQAMADYLDWYRVHRKAADDAEQKIRARILPELGDDEVEKLTLRRLRLWHQALGTAPARTRSNQEVPIRDEEALRRRKATANRILTTLKAALNMAVTDGRVAPGVAAAWRNVKPFKNVDAPTIRYFDPEEIQRLLAACEPDFRILVTGALLTGCRFGELSSARASAFLAQSRVLRVNGKTGFRVVYLSREGAEFFSGLVAGASSDSPLFRQQNGRGWRRSEQSRPMAAAASLARIPKPYNFHILRHTYASTYLMNGGSLSGLAQQLGHADTRMTTRHYAHLATTWRAQEAEQAGLRLGLFARGLQVSDPLEVVGSESLTTAPEPNPTSAVGLKPI